jgi:hypothetical protein
MFHNLDAYSTRMVNKYKIFEIDSIIEKDDDDEK